MLCPSRSFDSPSSRVIVIIAIFESQKANNVRDVSMHIHQGGRRYLCARHWFRDHVCVHGGGNA